MREILAPPSIALDQYSMEKLLCHLPMRRERRSFYRTRLDAKTPSTVGHSKGTCSITIATGPILPRRPASLRREHALSSSLVVT